MVILHSRAAAVSPATEKKKKKSNPYKSEKEIKIEKTMTVSQRVKAIIAQSKLLFTTRAYIHFLLGTAAT